MSKGIIVVEGAEEEHYNLLGKDRLHPIINVYPEENDIYNKLDSLLAVSYTHLDVYKRQLLNIPMKHDTKIRVLQDKNKVPVLYLKTI